MSVGEWNVYYSTWHKYYYSKADTCLRLPVIADKFKHDEASNQWQGRIVWQGAPPPMNKEKKSSQNSSSCQFLS